MHRALMKYRVWHGNLLAYGILNIEEDKDSPVFIWRFPCQSSSSLNHCPRHLDGTLPSTFERRWLIPVAGGSDCLGLQRKIQKASSSATSNASTAASVKPAPLRASSIVGAVLTKPRQSKRQCSAGARSGHTSESGRVPDLDGSGPLCPHRRTSCYLAGNQTESGSVGCRSNRIPDTEPARSKRNLPMLARAEVEQIVSAVGISSGVPAVRHITRRK